MRIAYPVFGIIILSLFFGVSNAFVNPADQCTSIGVTDDTCIMCSGTPCMMNTDPDICPGTVSPDEPAWGPIAWIGGSSPCICYCPYSLYQAYEAAHRNPCANVYCYDKCENSQEYRSGSCNSGTGLCGYATKNPCQYGCDGDFCAEAPEAEDKCANVYCRNKCENSQEYKRGTCNSNTGKCEYSTTNYCDYGCDGSSCAAATPAQDKCANVQCNPKCEGNTLKTDGECNSDTGRCVYSETACGDIGCNSSSLTCNQPAPGKIAGTVYYTEFMGINGQGDLAGKDVPLRFVAVSAYYKGTDNKMHHHQAGDEYVTYTDNDGKFSIDVPPDFFSSGVDTIYVNITLEDKGKRVAVSKEDNHMGTGSDAIVLIFGYDNPTAFSSLSNLDYNLYIKEPLGYTVMPNQRAAAQIYANTLKAVEFKENVIGLHPTTEERVTIFSDSGTWHQSEASSDKSATGMFITRLSSEYFSYEAPINREFHEYCHHIQDEAWDQESLRHPPGKDHAGYPANIQSSEWGMAEGWAEFCALEMKKYYYGVSDARYPALNTIMNLELDYRIQGGRLYDASKSNNLTSKFAEELAIAGIFIDLRDSASDYGGVDDDDVSMPLSTIWGAFSSQRDFGDGTGTRHVRTVHDFYVAISQAGGAPQADIDHIFIRHGAFQDLNKNGKWDAGESIGYSGIGSAQTDYRPDLEPEPGTQVMVSAKDGSGNTLANGVLVDVSVSFGGANSYLSYSYRAPVMDGMIYLPLPPREYNATITMAAVQGGSNAKASTAYTTTTAEAYAEIDPQKPLATYDAAIPSAKAQTCSSAGQCIAWNMGDTCKSGSCTYATSSGAASSGALCLGPAAIAFAAGFLAWRRKG
jgi:hypothetical protein